MRITNPITTGLLLFCASCLLQCKLTDDKPDRNTQPAGNVAGIITDHEGRTVKGAKVSLFRKVSAIDSPQVEFKAFSESETDGSGRFAFDVEDGMYTLVATDGEEYAFLNDVEAGTEAATDLKGELLPPGGLKGKIENTLELTGTASIVAHLINTRIYVNVGSDGVFRIDDIPAGTYTFAAYSTHQPEFSPVYKTVTIFPDSLTDLSEFQLNYNGIPIPKNIRVSFDTAREVVTIAWDSITSYQDLEEYVVMRGPSNVAKHDLKQIGFTRNTVFYDTISFDSSQVRPLEYRVFAVNKLGDAGRFFGTYPIVAVSAASQIPVVANFQSAYDTLEGTVRLTWDSVRDFENFGGYLLTRTLRNPKLRSGQASLDTLGILQSNSFRDTIYPNRVPLENTDSTVLAYDVRVLHKGWDRYGAPQQDSLGERVVHAFSYRRFKPSVEAGNDIQVDVSGTVTLRGSVLSHAFPIVKKEWKIKDGNWIAFTDSLYEFDAGDEYKEETFACSLRVSDAAGNVARDFLTVKKSLLITSYDPYQSGLGTSTTIVKFDGKYWTMGSKVNSQATIRSSPDMATWEVHDLAGAPDPLPSAVPVKTLTDFDGRLFLLFQEMVYGANFTLLADSNFTVFSSPDGKAWTRLEHNLPPLRTRNQHDANWDYLRWNNQLFISTYDVDSTLYRTTDGKTWSVYAKGRAFGRLFSIGDTLCYASGAERFCTPDEGASWQPRPLWETDAEYRAGQDGCKVLISRDGRSILEVKENPGGKRRILYSSGKGWIEIPVPIQWTEDWRPSWAGSSQAFAILENRFFYYRSYPHNRWESVVLPK